MEVWSWGIEVPPIHGLDQSRVRVSCQSWCFTVFIASNNELKPNWSETWTREQTKMKETMVDMYFRQPPGGDCHNLASLLGAVMSMAECVASRNCIASKMNISRQTWRHVFVLTMFRFRGCTTTCCHCVSVMADSWSLSDSHLWGSTSNCRMEVLLVQSWPD